MHVELQAYPCTYTPVHYSRELSNVLPVASKSVVAHCVNWLD